MSQQSFCPSCGWHNQPGIQRCSQCGTQMPLAALVPKKSNALKYVSLGCLGLIGLSILGIVILSAIGRKAIETAKSASPAVTVSPTASPALAWSFYEGADDMSGKSIKIAKAVSSNTVNFGFPYAGAQHGTLTVRKHPRAGSDVILAIERGQFLAHASGVEVLVRFDNQSAMKFWGTGPEDNSTTIIFLNNYAKFVAQLRKAKIVRISTPVYQEGSPVFEFNVAGFEER